MSFAQVKVTDRGARFRKMAVRTIVILAIAFLLGLVIRHGSAYLESNPRPAGFGQGMLQGALMPCTMPYLLAGHDAFLYNPNNTGIPYKLGYTCGVNACGAVFFGILFWRVNRWRKRLSQARSEVGDPSR